MPKGPKAKRSPTAKKKAKPHPDASQTALSIVESIIGGKLVEKPKRPKKKIS